MRLTWDKKAGTLEVATVVDGRDTEKVIRITQGDTEVWLSGPHYTNFCAQRKAKPAKSGLLAMDGCSFCNRGDIPSVQGNRWVHLTVGPSPTVCIEPPKQKKGENAWKAQDRLNKERWKSWVTERFGTLKLYTEIVKSYNR